MEIKVENYFEWSNLAIFIAHFNHQQHKGKILGVDKEKSHYETISNGHLKIKF